MGILHLVRYRGRSSERGYRGNGRQSWKLIGPELMPSPVLQKTPQRGERRTAQQFKTLSWWFARFFFSTQNSDRFHNFVYGRCAARQKFRVEHKKEIVSFSSHPYFIDLDSRKGIGTEKPNLCVSWTISNSKKVQKIETKEESLFREWRKKISNGGEITKAVLKV